MKPIHKEFLKILADYQGIIHKVNLIYFKSAMDKQDNFQEIVYQLWKAFPSLKNTDKLASWIYAVAINTSISKVRKDCRLEFHESVAGFTDQAPAQEEGENRQIQRLFAALYELNEIDKSVMLLYMEDYSYKEIAAITGIGVSNVGVKIHRLKNQLQKRLNG